MIRRLRTRRAHRHAVQALTIARAARDEAQEALDRLTTPQEAHQ